jgi:dTMP kinase
MIDIVRFSFFYDPKQLIDNSTCEGDMNMRKDIGKFIVFEGIDGAGKTAQARLLTDRMRERNLPFHATLEPTHNLIGAVIRKHTNSGEIKLDERVLAQLFAADRLDHLTNPEYGNLAKLENGIHVIQDRYYLSSIGYQGTLTGLVEYVTILNESIRALKRPDLTILLDGEPEILMERITSKRANLETYEQLDLQKQIREQYLITRDMLIAEGERFFTIDATMEIDTIANRVWEEVSPLFA